VVRQKTFKLVRPTLALDVVDGKQRVVTLPAEAIVIARVSSPDGSGLVSVSWDARSLRMFAIDLSTRGIEITEPKQNMEFPGATTLPSMTGSGEWTGS